MSVVSVFENIPGLTGQRLTDGVQRRKTDGADLPRFDLGEIDVGDPHLLRQFVQRHFSVRHYAVES